MSFVLFCYKTLPKNYVLKLYGRINWNWENIWKILEIRGILILTRNLQNTQKIVFEHSLDIIDMVAILLILGRKTLHYSLKEVFEWIMVVEQFYKHLKMIELNNLLKY